MEAEMAPAQTAKKVAKAAKAETAVLERIAQMPPPCHAMGERIHEIVTESAPELAPITWYSMPTYAKDGKIICFFCMDDKCMTFGTTQDAPLAHDKSAVHQLVESAWYLAALDDATEAKLADIVRKAAS
jgi:hypothetical protein